MSGTRFPQSASGIAIGAPIALVLLLRVMSGIGPAESPAAQPTGPEMPAVVSSVSTDLSESDQAAIAWLKENGGRIPERSPMLRPHRGAPEIVAVPTGPAEPDPASVLTLASVAGAGDRAVASINGEIYRVRQSPLEGWTIVQISSRERLVSLEHVDGRVIELRQ